MSEARYLLLYLHFCRLRRIDTCRLRRGDIRKEWKREKKKSNMMDVKHHGYVLSTSLATLLLNYCYYKFHLEFLNLEYITARTKRARLCNILKIVMSSTYLGMFFALRGGQRWVFICKNRPPGHVWIPGAPQMLKVPKNVNWKT